MSAANDRRFGDVERQYAALKSQLTAGQLTREQFEAALQQLIILDEQRRYWMMGAESGKWYQYDGQQWVQTEPPHASAATPPSPPSDAEHAAFRADAMTMAAFTPPPVDQSALTMPAFTPPQATTPPPAIQSAVTMPAFMPPQTTALVPPPPPPPAAQSGRRWSPMLVLGLLFICVCALGAIGLAIALAARFNNPPSPPTSAPILVSTATSALPTATILPPTTPTTAPTVTPPLPTPTRTPLARPSPPIIVPPTLPPTAVPTDTPVPTNTPIPPPPPTDTPVPPPTNTSVPPPPPTKTPAVVVEFPVTFNYQGYAKWGRPDPNNCSINNNKSPVLQFKWDASVTNKTATTITDSDWFLPTALNNEGGSARVCYYSPPNIPPGQTARATFVAYIELNQFVARITQKIRNTTYVRCLDSANPPREVSC